MNSLFRKLFPAKPLSKVARASQDRVPSQAVGRFRSDKRDEKNRLLLGYVANRHPERAADISSRLNEAGRGR